GPITNLVLATGGLITVTNPTGPIVDLTIGGGIGPGSETVSFSGQVWHFAADTSAPGYGYYEYTLAGTGHGWLAKDGYFIAPGDYSAELHISISTALTVGSPTFTEATWTFTTLFGSGDVPGIYTGAALDYTDGPHGITQGMIAANWGTPTQLRAQVQV